MSVKLNKTSNKEQEIFDPTDWVMEYADYLYSYAIKRLDDAELAKDLVQESFLAGLEGWEKFHKKSSVKTWLTAILKNKIYDTYRKKYSLQGKTILLGDANIADYDFFEKDGHWKADKTPVYFGIEENDALESKELIDVLNACLMKLPPLWQSVFMMKHIDGEPSDTIMASLQLTSANFWVISHRAKVSLRDCMQKNWV